ncbi:hypothetical protein HF998_00150 [Cellulomonas hominis]|nr:hypothetical protein [Cellulomonas hominis]MBB5474764.1 hypothetical protein [Cellulomonas hominis]NKY05420.1 hypothetical protein [Cellulomonas hominis]
MPSKSKRKGSAPDVWQDAAELPRAGLPDERARSRAHRRMTRYAMVSMVSLPLLIVLTALAVMSTLSRQETPPPAAESAPATQPLAMAAVENWLHEDPAPLPGASLLTWEDYEVLPLVVDTSTSQPDRTRREAHTLLVRSHAGTLLRVQVMIAVSEEGGQAVVGAPSLSATAGTDQDLTGTALWSGLQTDSPSPDVAKAIDTWVAAYTSGDPLALRQAVGDPDANHTYLPLSGLTGAKATTSVGAWLTEGDGDSAVRTGDMVVSLTMTLPWTGVVDDAGRLPQASFDLLVTDADTAAPRVVAWGGPGTGPTLSAYGNAVLGSVAEAPAAVATTAPDLTTEG